MPRWEGDARVRLVSAALQLFSEKGYDNTTVAEITQRAGLTKSTFFRYFPDKRDVLAAGQETMSRLLAEGVTEAPAGVSPLDAVGAGLRRVAAEMTPLNRQLAPQVHAVIASSAELQARDHLKQVGMAAAVSAALRARGVADVVAALAAEVGMLAFKDAFTTWTTTDNEHELADLADTALKGLRAAIAELG